MAALLVLVACLVSLSSACDVCGDPNHMMSPWEQNNMQAQQMMQWQQQQMMMNMMNQMMQQNNWGNNGGQQPSKPSGGQPSRPAGDSQGRCDGFADVVLLIDSSQSIGEDNFKTLLQFSAGVVGNFQLANNGRDGYQFSIVQFSSGAKEEFSLKDYNSIQALQQAISRIPYQSQSTETHKGLQYVRQNSFALRWTQEKRHCVCFHSGLIHEWSTRDPFQPSGQQVNTFQCGHLTGNQVCVINCDKRYSEHGKPTGHGGRNGAIKIVIVITDGRSSQPSETKKEADALRQSGALILSIGIGDADPIELESIASSKKNVFKVDNFNVLDTIAKEVKDRACDITIEEGGGSANTASASKTEFTWDAYIKWCMQQVRMKGEKEIAEEVLMSFEKFKQQEHKKDESKNTEKEEKQHHAYMVEKVQKTQKWLMEAEKKGNYLMELKHKHIYMVTSEMIKFCPMKAMMESDIMRMLIHGDSHWTPGRADQCDNEDMDKMDSTLTAAQAAQQVANESREKQIEMFFYGLKDSVCAGLETYVNQVKSWEDQFPGMKKMMGMMF